MWQSLSNLVSSDSRALQGLVAAIVLVVLLGTIFAVYRLVFAHRLRVPGAARGRAPRLGVVDVFSLDGQRQLVIVRRDNVEHLLLIGGPNDVVVEPQIVRGAASAGNNRDAAKALAEPPQEPVAAPLPRPVAPAAMPPRRAPLRTATETPALPQVLEPEPVAVAEPPKPPAPRVEVAPPRPPAEPAPPRAVETIVPKPPEPRAEAPAPPRAIELPGPGAEPKPDYATLRKTAAAPKPVAPPLRPNLPAPITPLRARPLDAAPAIEPPKPAKAAEATSAPPIEIAPPALAAIVPPAPAGEKRRGEETFYDLESLEAEMARLLGRDG